jgi:hypothetical protein
MATMVPLLSQMEPDRSTIAAGAPVDIDISHIRPGQQIQARWRDGRCSSSTARPHCSKCFRTPS